MPIISTFVALLIVECTISGIVTGPTTLIARHFTIASFEVLLLALLTPLGFIPSVVQVRLRELSLIIRS